MRQQDKPATIRVTNTDMALKANYDNFKLQKAIEDLPEIYQIDKGDFIAPPSTINNDSQISFTSPAKIPE